jgi:hypothetical protein
MSPIRTSPQERRAILQLHDATAYYEAPWLTKPVTSASRAITRSCHTPLCALLPARVVTTPLGTRPSPHRLVLTLPHGGCPSRLPSALLRRRALPCVPRSVATALTGPCCSCSVSGHAPGGAHHVRRASQAAHTADPCARSLVLTMRTRWGYDWSSQASYHAGVLGDNPTPVGSAACLF